jgi:hypothetical protein
MTGSENDQVMEKEYVPFLVNKSLSYFPDTLLYANEMNKYHFLDKKIQFYYLLNSVRPRKRFAKWSKRDDSENVEAIRLYYGYSIDKAYQALSVLSKEQLKTIKEILEEVKDERGGRFDRGKTSW